MNLAELLGYASIKKMLSEITSEDISEWIAYFNVKKQKGDEDRDRTEKEEAAKARAKAANE